MSRFLRALLAIAALLVPGYAGAAQVKEINWKELIPKTAALKDPLSGLTQDQRFDLETIAWVRTLGEEERKLAVNRQGVEDARKFERKFEKAGIDVEKLLQDYASWQAKVEERQKLVVNALDGQRVKLAGYLLPLEYSEKGNTQFLLVPYVGACIHVPPPPPNQIVYVRLSKKFVVTDLFTPVWLTGTMRTKASSKSLHLIDGSSNVSVGYHLDGDQVEPYEAK